MLYKKINGLYFTRLEFLFYKGLEEGRIVPFDDEFYNKLKGVYVSGLPVSIYIKHLRPMTSPGKCFERSLYLFFCFEDALLVRGSHKNLKLKYGKAHSGHGWVEMGDYVYDTTYLMRFEKDLYYEMFKCSKIKTFTHEEYRSGNPEYYDDIMNTSVKDFQTGGRKRIDLMAIIPLVYGNAELSGHEELLKDLNEFLKLIQYNEKEVCEELENKVYELMKKEGVLV